MTADSYPPKGDGAIRYSPVSASQRALAWASAGPLSIAQPVVDARRDSGEWRAAHQPVACQPAQASVTATTPDGRTALTGRSASDRKSIHYSELSISTDSAETSHQRHFFRGSWFDALEVYWQDITRPGRLKDRYYDDAATHRMSGSRGAGYVTQRCVTLHSRVSGNWRAPCETKAISITRDTAWRATARRH